MTIPLSEEAAPTESQVEKYKLLYPLLTSIRSEVKDLSKKKQDETLNKLKVEMINKVLSQIKKGVLNDEPSNEFLDLLDVDTLPSNSDAVLIIAQYDTALNQFRSRHFGWEGRDQRWFTKEHPRKKK